MNKSCDLCTLFQRRSLVVFFLNSELSELSQKKYSVSRILANYLPVGIHLFSLVWTRYGRLVRSVLVSEVGSGSKLYAYLEKSAVIHV